MINTQSGSAPRPSLCRESVQLSPYLLSPQEEAQLHQHAESLTIEERVILEQLATCPISGISTEALLDLIGPDIGTRPTVSSLHGLLRQLAENGWVHQGYGVWHEPGGFQFFVRSPKGQEWVMAPGVRIFCLEHLARYDDLEEIEAYMEKGVLQSHQLVSETDHLVSLAVAPH